MYLETTIRIHDGFGMSDKKGVNSGDGVDSTTAMSDKMSDKMSEQEEPDWIKAVKMPAG